MITLNLRLDEQISYNFYKNFYIIYKCIHKIIFQLDRYEKKSLKRENPRSVSYKSKVTKIMFIVLIVFIILRIPFTVLVIIRGQNYSNPTMADKIDGYFQILWYTSHYLIFLNCAVNPLIYGLNNEHFQKAFKHTTFFPCCKRKIKVNILNFSI